jgi:hypothetical protein
MIDILRPEYLFMITCIMVNNFSKVDQGGLAKLLKKIVSNVFKLAYMECAQRWRGISYCGSCPALCFKECLKLSHYPLMEGTVSA